MTALSPRRKEDKKEPQEVLNQTIGMEITPCFFIPNERENQAVAVLTGLSVVCDGGPAMES